MRPTNFKPQPPVIQLGALFDKPSPQAPEAEQALLGAIIIDPNVLGDVRELVPSPGMFYSEANGTIFEALVALHDSNRGGDLVELVTRLRANERRLDDVGGITYLEKLARETPGAAGAMYWARIVREKWQLRRVVEISGKAIHAAYTTESGDPTEVIDGLETDVFDLTCDAGGVQTCQPLSVLLQAEFDRLESRDGGAPGIPTGFDDLDKLLGGLAPGDLIIIAGRPSMGKTSLGLDIARNVGMQGIPTGIFSLEMTRKAVTSRLLAAQEGVSVQATITNTLTDHDREKLIASEFVTKVPPIYLDDASGLSVSQIRSRARRMVRKSGVQLIVIDYLQLMTDPTHRESRQVEVSAISRGLKALAKELNIPVVVLAQLNRSAETRTENRPRMSDLRESGAIEQDADVVILLHREEYFHVGETEWRLQNPDKIGVGEAIVAKQRNGPTDSVTLTWRAVCSSFANHAGNSRTERAYVEEGEPSWAHH